MQANQQQQLDAIDKKLLNEIQWVFPLVDRPYLEIAKRYDISEKDVMHRIAFMKDIGVIRQINAIFDTRRLGYKSALIAFAVRPDKLDYVAKKVNEHPGVSQTTSATMSTICGSRLQYLLDQISSETLTE